MKFRYYLAISIMIHIISVFSLNLSNNKDELLGEKLAPIEILNNKTERSLPNEALCQPRVLHIL